MCQLTGAVIEARGEGMLLGRDVCVCARAGACVEVNGKQKE